MTARNKPTRLRREGWDAFSPGENPDNLNPYLRDYVRHRKGHWREGWDQAAESWADREAEESELAVKLAEIEAIESFDDLRAYLRGQVEKGNLG